MTSREALARNIRKLRQERGMSQEELADKANLDRTYISSLERRRYAATIDVVDKLAKALGSDASNLLLQPDGVVK